MFCLLSVMVLTACSEDIDTSSPRYVFSEHTAVSYLESHPGQYGQYVALLRLVPVSKLSRTTLYQLLSARGNYTVFAPTDQAISEYLQRLVDEELISQPSWDAFKAFPDSTKLDSVRRVIVMNSIIDGGDYESQRYYYADLTAITNNGELPLANLCDHKLTVSWPKKGIDSLFIGGDCLIDSRNYDIPVLNGVIHQVHRVIAPGDKSAAHYFRQTLETQREGYLVYARLLEACGLLDTLGVVRDEVYEDKYQRGEIPDYENFLTRGWTDLNAQQTDDACMPAHRLIGFTLFLEPDAFWQEQGIDPRSEDLPDQVQRWVVEHEQLDADRQLVADAHYDSPDNILFQWVTYHILPFRVAANKLVYHENEKGYYRSQPFKYATPVYEYYTTMGDRRLLKIIETSMSDGVCLNRFPQVDRARKGSGKEVACDADKVGCRVERENELTLVNEMVNAAVYPIFTPLGYTSQVRNELAKERIRFDGMSLFPEAMTNELRRCDSHENHHQFVYITPNSIYKYFDNMSINDDATFIYFNGYGYNWPNYCNDEMKAVGNYDLMFTLPPVPRRGTYEVRYKVLATAARGIVQLYFGSNPDNLPVTGIPIDIRKDLKAGLPADMDITETDDDDYNAEMDKFLRNNNRMRGCRSVADGGNSERENIVIQRVIVTRQTLDPGETYYLRCKSVLDKTTNELYMDYIEFCPKEIYDNPETPEDIW